MPRKTMIRGKYAQTAQAHRAFRKLLGLTAEELAKKSGFSVDSIKAWESGRAPGKRAFSNYRTMLFVHADACREFAKRFFVENIGIGYSLADENPGDAAARYRFIARDSSGNLRTRMCVAPDNDPEAWLRTFIENPELIETWSRLD